MIGIMPRRWTAVEEAAKRIELVELDERQNRSIGDIAAALLGRSEVTIYQRLRRLGIPVRKERKPGYLRARVVTLPPLSGDLAEFCGIMLGSASLVRALAAVGLASSNKVRDQVGVPEWIFEAPEHRRRFLRGFFDTDGCLYRLKGCRAVQMSFRNRSLPLLAGARQALLDLGFHPSRVSSGSVYLTRRGDIRRYIQEIGFGNAKHRLRATAFGLRPPSGQAP